MSKRMEGPLQVRAHSQRCILLAFLAFEWCKRLKLPHALRLPVCVYSGEAMDIGLSCLRLRSPVACSIAAAVRSLCGSGAYSPGNSHPSAESVQAEQQRGLRIWNIRLFREWRAGGQDGRMGGFGCSGICSVPRHASAG